MYREILKKLHDYVAFFALFIVMLLCFKQCQRADILESNLQVEKDNVRTYKDKNGDLVEYNNVINTKFKDLEIYNSELKKEIRDMKIKSPEVIIRSTTELRVDTVYIEFHDTLPCQDFVKKIDVDSTWYDIHMTLTKESLTIDSMKIPNEQIVTIGEKKNGLFKKNEHIVAVKNTNPHISTDTLETYTFKKDRKFFERPSVNLTIGIFAGIIAAKLLLK